MLHNAGASTSVLTKCLEAGRVHENYVRLPRSYHIGVTVNDNTRLCYANIKMYQKHIILDSEDINETIFRIRHEEFGEGIHYITSVK